VSASDITATPIAAMQQPMTPNRLVQTQAMQQQQQMTGTPLGLAQQMQHPIHGSVLGQQLPPQINPTQLQQAQPLQQQMVSTVSTPHDTSFMLPSPMQYVGNPYGMFPHGNMQQQQAPEKSQYVKFDGEYISSVY